MIRLLAPVVCLAFLVHPVLAQEITEKNLKELQNKVSDLERKLAEATKRLEQMEKKLALLQAEQLYQQAQALERTNDNPGAVKKMSEAIALLPDNDLYLAYTSHVERLSGRYADGVKHALQAIKINPKVGWYYASVAFNAHANKDLVLAREYCKKVVEFGVEKVGQENYDYAKKLLDELKSKK